MGHLRAIAAKGRGTELKTGNLSKGRKVNGMQSAGNGWLDSKPPQK